MEVMRIHAPQTVEWDIIDDGTRFGDPAIDELEMPVPEEGELIQLIYVVRKGRGVLMSATHIAIPPPGTLPGE